MPAKKLNYVLIEYSLHVTCISVTFTDSSNIKFWLQELSPKIVILWIVSPDPGIVGACQKFRGSILSLPIPETLTVTRQSKPLKTLS